MKRMKEYTGDIWFLRDTATEAVFVPNEVYKAILEAKDCYIRNTRYWVDENGKVWRRKDPATGNQRYYPLCRVFPAGKAKQALKLTRKEVEEAMKNDPRTRPDERHKD